MWLLLFYLRIFFKLIVLLARRASKTFYLRLPSSKVPEEEFTCLAATSKSETPATSAATARGARAWRARAAMAAMPTQDEVAKHLAGIEAMRVLLSDAEVTQMRSEYLSQLALRLAGAGSRPGTPAVPAAPGEGALSVGDGSVVGASALSASLAGAATAVAPTAAPGTRAGGSAGAAGAAALPRESLGAPPPPSSAELQNLLLGALGGGGGTGGLISTALLPAGALDSTALPPAAAAAVPAVPVRPAKRRRGAARVVDTLVKEIPGDVVRGGGVGDARSACCSSSSCCWPAAARWFLFF